MLSSWPPENSGHHETNSLGLPLAYLALRVVASAFLVMTAMYLMSTGVGQDKVLGVQGRYFIPLLVLAGVAGIEFIPACRYSIPKVAQHWLISPLSALTGIIAMDTTIIHAFHVF